MKESYDENQIEEDLINIVGKYAQELRGIVLYKDDIAEVVDLLTIILYRTVDNIISKAMGD